VVAALPFAREHTQEALERRGVLGGGWRSVFDEREGFAAGGFEEIFVAEGIGDVEAEVA